MKRGHKTAGGVSVHVKGKNVTVTPVLRDQVVHKMQRLDKYLDRLSEIEVELCHEQTREAAKQNSVEATAQVLGRTVRVRAHNSDMVAAIDEVVDKVYRQLNRHKERIKAHHGAKLAETLPTAEDGDLPFDDEEAEPVVLVERPEMKPQFEDEAIEEMLAAGRDFYVFLNARDEKVNVIYRRADGAFGLIQPVAR